MIAAVGGRCQKCGYNKNLAALDFHHQDPSQKEFTWNSVSVKPWDKIIEEMKKCVLLCANCHREEHHPETTITDETFVFPPCPGCGKALPFGDDYCSSECMYRHRRKVERPTKNELIMLMQNQTNKEIAQQYDVSDNTVTMWAAHYGIGESRWRKFKNTIED